MKLPFDPEDFDPKAFHIMYMDWTGECTRTEMCGYNILFTAVIVDITISIVINISMINFDNRS